MHPLRLRLVLVLVALLVGLGVTSAWAARIVIDSGDDPDSRLELRTITLPDGSEAQIYVLEGRDLRITIDDNELTASHVEFDLSNRLVRVIGYGRYSTAAETVAGDGLLIDLGEETFQAKDVLITTSAIDVSGDSASRVPGQISVLAGRFSPCSRCSQEIEDYGFVAARLELFPGDRLVAYDVTVLFRGVATFQVPFMVLPLGPPDRQPRLSITTGSDTERAEFKLRWPYVAGPNAYGNVSLEYYADVNPGAGGWFQNTLFGGAIRTSYLGGGIEHVFYTQLGTGKLVFHYTPSFVENDLKTDDAFTVRFDYATEPEVGLPSLALSVARADEVRQRLWEYGLRTTHEGSGVRGTFSSQGFVDLRPTDDVTTPSYDSRNTPLFTVARLELEPSDLAAYRFGAFEVQRLLLDLGAFQDASNPTNRSAALTPDITSGRAKDGYTVRLQPLELWAGMTVGGASSFDGSYYGTGERLIDWSSRVEATQRIGDAVSLSVTFTRNTAEGETPFTFDQIALRSRTDVAAELLLQPLSWAQLAVRGGYVFVDNRNPDALGIMPIDSTLTLFQDESWIGISVRNAYDIEKDDPGTIDSTLTLRAPDNVRAELELRHIQDLKITPDRLTGADVDATHTTVKAGFGYVDLISLDAAVGYVPNPQEPEAGEPTPYWDPLELSVTLGSARQDDFVPGLKVTYTRDLNVGELTALAFEVTARIGPVQLLANERLGLPLGSVASSTLSATWPGVAVAKAEGLAWLPPEWLGLPTDPDANRPLSFSVSDAPLRGSALWQVAYTTVYDPLLLAGAGGYRNSAVTARALLTDRELGPARFTVDFFSDLQLKDDVLELTYLRRANLTFGLDLYERVGLQGTVGYNGSYNPTSNEVTRAQLSLDSVALIVRPIDELYVGAVLNDVWDLSGNDPTRPAFNLQPTFVAAWNRCCWALYGSWDSATGVIKVALTTPGTEQGLQQVFDTGLRIPGSKE